MKPVVAVAVEQKDIEQGLVLSLKDTAEVRRLSPTSPLVMARALSDTPPDVLVLGSEGRATSELVDMIHWTCPSTLIVLYAVEGREEDAAIVERGIYFYAPGASVEMLTDVVLAALRRTQHKNP